MSMAVPLKLCEHCKGDIEIRNPKGFCDHLYYPDACPTCRIKVGGGKFSLEEMKAENKALRNICHDIIQLRATQAGKKTWVIKDGDEEVQADLVPSWLILKLEEVIAGARP